MVSRVEAEKLVKSTGYLDSLGLGTFEDFLLVNLVGVK